MKIRPSSYAKPIFTNKYYEADVWGGRGRGGSHNLTLHALFEMMTSNYFRGYFVRAIHGHIRDSLWQDFKDRINEVSELNGFDLSKQFSIQDTTMSAIHLPTGNQIKSKGFKASTKGNTAHMKSIAGATHVYIEECEEVGEDEYNKLADSLRTTKAPIKILRSWNAPPKDHWLIAHYYDLEESIYDGYYKAIPKGIPNHISIYGTFKDNIKNLDSNTLARYDRYQETNPKYFYNQILGLVSDGGDSKVYYNWKRVTYQEFLQIDGYEVMGLDFGDTAPTALVSVKYKDGCFYRYEMLYDSLRSLQIKYKHELEQIRGVNTDNSIWGKHKGLLSYVFDRMGVDKQTHIYCDPAQKGLILELRDSGYMAVAAKKDKAANINFINRAHNFYTDNSINLEHEYNHYYLDLDINKNPIDGKPIKGNDHALEAAEYACRGIKDELDLVL